MCFGLRAAESYLLEFFGIAGMGLRFSAEVSMLKNGGDTHVLEVAYIYLSMLIQFFKGPNVMPENSLVSSSIAGSYPQK